MPGNCPKVTNEAGNSKTLHLPPETTRTAQLQTTSMFDPFNMSKEKARNVSVGEGGGVKPGISSVSPACHKRLLNGAVSRNNRIKR